MSDEIQKQEFDPVVRDEVVANAIAEGHSPSLSLKELWQEMEKPSYDPNDEPEDDE